MALVDKTIDGMLEEIEFTHLTYYEIMPSHYHGRAYSGKCFSPTGDVIGSSGLRMATGVFDLETCVGYALENVWLHAMKEQPWPEMSIKGFVGKKGIIIRIRDQGEGFDPKEVHRKYLAKEPYCHRFGFGFKFFDTTQLEISFEDNGTTINIMYTRPS